MSNREEIENLYIALEDRLYGRNNADSLINRIRKEEEDYKANEKKYKIIDYERKQEQFSLLLEEAILLYQDFFNLSKKAKADPDQKHKSRILLEYLKLFISKIQDIYLFPIAYKLNHKQVNRSLIWAFIAIISSITISFSGVVCSRKYSYDASEYYYNKNKIDGDSLSQVNLVIMDSDSTKTIPNLDSYIFIARDRINLNKQVDSIQTELNRIIQQHQETELAYIKRKLSDSLKIERLKKDMLELINTNE